MEFLKLNLKKIPKKLLLNLAIFECIFSILYFISYFISGPGTTDAKISMFLIVPVALSLLMVLLNYFANWFCFYTSKKIFHDTSDKNITSLFDPGYSITLINQNRSVYYTQKALVGKIKGYPSMMSYALIPASNSRNHASSILLEVNIIDAMGDKITVKERFGVSISFRIRLDHDIKPEVLMFFDKLMEENKPGELIYNYAPASAGA